MKNLFRKTAAIVCSAAAALFLAAAALMLLPLCENLRIALLRHQVSRLGAGELRAEGFTTDIFSGIRLRGVQLTDEQYDLKIGQCIIEYRLLELLKKPPLLRSLHIDSMLLTVRETESRPEPEHAGGEFSPAESLKLLRIGAFSLQRSRVDIITADHTRSASLNGLQISGSEQEPFVYDITISADTARFSGSNNPVAASLVTGRLHVSPNNVSLEKLQADLFQGKIHADARLAASPPYQFSGSLTADGLHSAPLTSGFIPEHELPGPSPVLSGKAAVSGALNTIEKTSFSIELAAGSADRAPHTVLYVSGRADSAGAVFSGSWWQGNSRLQLKQGHISGRLSLSVPDISSIPFLPEPAGLQGGIRVEALASGTMEEPELTADIQASHLLYQRIPLDTVSAELNYRQGQWLIRQGTFAVVKYPAALLPADTAGLNIQGTLSVNGQIAGPIGQPAVEGELLLHGVSGAGFPKTDGRVHLRSRQNTISLESLTLSTDSLTVEGSGAWDTDTLNGSISLTIGRAGPRQTGSPAAGRLRVSYDGRSRFARFSAASIELTVLGSLLKGAGFSDGTAAAAGTIELTDTAPNVFLEGSVRGPVYRGVHIDSLLFAGSLTERNLRVTRLDLYSEKSSARAELTVPFSDRVPAPEPAAPLSGQLRFSNMDLSLFEPLLKESLQGRTDLNLSVSGSMTHPLFFGTMSVRNGAYGKPDSPVFLDSLNSLIHFHHDTVTVSRLQAAALGRQLNASGFVRVHSFSEYTLDTGLRIDSLPAARLAGRITEDSLRLSLSTPALPLGLLQPLQLPLKDLQGTMRLDAVLTKDPEYRLNGILRADIGQFRIEPFQEKFKDGTLSVRLRGSTIGIDTLQFFQKKDGACTVSGEISLKAQKPDAVFLRARAKKITLTSPGLLQAELDTMRLTYSLPQTEGTGALRGGISFKRVSYTQPLALSRLTAASQKPGTAQEPLAPFAARTELDISIGGSDQFLIDNNLARLRFRPELTIENTLADPRPRGHITVIEGEVFYLDREFTIEKATLDFTDPYRINPVIDLRAVSELNKYETEKEIPIRVTMTIQGSLDQPVFQLSSEPPYGEADLISLMLLGISRGGSGENRDLKDVPLSEALQDRAAELGSHQIKGIITRRMEQMFSIDELSIEGNIFKPGQPAGPRLIAAKKISNKITLRYRSPAGSSSRHHIQLNYQLTPVWFLTGEIDQQGQSGLDIKYEIKLK